MSWDAVSAIAEAIGAGVVLLTLFYLSFQLRQNTRAVQRSAERSITEDASTWMYKIADNPELANIYRRGVRGEQLEPDDKLRFRMMMGALFLHWNHAYKVGAFDIVKNSNIAGVLSQPGGLEYWQNSQAGRDLSFDPGFAQYLNEVHQQLRNDAEYDV
ncbi:MAG: hypothetical protein ACI9XK_004115 [Granulosicoccus sp.]|jgi:hypothetical protein